MHHVIFLVRNDFVQVDILHAAENVLFDLRIFLCQLGDQLLHHHTLGNRPFVRITGSAGVREVAGTLDKLQVVIPAPVLDVGFPNQVHGANQLHALEIGTVQLRHHGFHLSAVDHAHENRFNDIVKMVSQSDLITAQFLCLVIQMSTPHTGTEIAGVILHVIHRIKNIGFEHGNGNLQQLGVGFDDLPVLGTIAGIHDQKDQFKGKFSVPLNLLKQLRHEHRVLAAGNTHGNAVVGLNQVIGLDCLGKPAEDHPMKLFPQSLFHFGSLFVFGFPPDLLLKPLDIAAHQIHCRVAFFPQLFRHISTQDTAAAVDHQCFILGQILVRGFQFLLRDQHCPVDMPQSKRRTVPHVDDLTGRRLHGCQFLYCDFFYHVLTSPNRGDTRRFILKFLFLRRYTAGNSCPPDRRPDCHSRCRIHRSVRRPAATGSQYGFVLPVWYL